MYGVKCALNMFHQLVSGIIDIIRTGLETGTVIVLNYVTPTFQARFADAGVSALIIATSFML